MDETEWVLDRIIDMYPGEEHPVGMIIPQLIEAIIALRGARGGVSVFGLAGVAVLDPDRIPDILALAADALRAWRTWCGEHDHANWIPDIDRILGDVAPPG